MNRSRLAPDSESSPAEEFSVQEVRGCTVVSVVADLDIATAEAFAGLIAEAVASERPVVIDLTACGYADSTGLRAIAIAHPTLPAGSGIVVAPTGTVRRLFSITGFDVALAPCSTLAEALRRADA